MAKDRNMLFGIHSVGEWLRADPSRFESLLVAPGGNDRVQKLVNRARDCGIPVETLPKQRLQGMAGPRNAQGVGARVKPFPYADLDLVLEAVEVEPLLLIVDGVTDPGNLGAIIRSAAFFGVHAILLPRDRSAIIGPVVERSAAGAAATVPICQINSLLGALQMLLQRGFIGVASVVGGHPHPAEQDLTGPVVLMVGSEGKGLRPSLRKAATLKTSLPSVGPASLNVSAFAGVLLYEAARQRRDS